MERTSTVPGALPGTRPTDGQLALAQAIAEGCTRVNQAIATVPAAVYTDPAHWQRENGSLFSRLPQVLCPSALLPMCVLTALIVWRHRGNLRRLTHGTERRITLGGGRGA